nr:MULTISPECIES: type VII secretion protein EssB/YukC [Lacticaseibacillus]
MIEATDFAAIKALIDQNVAIELERTRMTKGSGQKDHGRFYRTGFYTALAAVIALIAVVVYLMAFKAPADARIQASEESYLKADYAAAIKDLKMSSRESYQRSSNTFLLRPISTLNTLVPTRRGIF